MSATKSSRDLANVVVLLAKVVVGLSTGSFAVLGDAIHSLTDAANNVVALVVVRVASTPPDREHPYGHREFETLAVFGLATLLTEAVRSVSGVRQVRRVRSRWVGATPSVDVVIAVDPQLSTVEAHAIADTIEALLKQQYAIEDATMHSEPV
jgi:divalent metal cation (Fe/Co/Zn/Cd) transporter